ncbi:hypothetical protein [Rubrivirga marina]|uniref:Uncharacterized protein n=1 Tax=Rubrivirga marina TaxID=1196024 RepID=A0A271J4V9_9BACT|nr:hypothetical protein [Rubrivirga marina]PAP78338.1 hypothetical protein BSZ37_18885 [Rubrivirga marina]
MRTYSEREVSAIIERAVERQQAAEEGGGDAGLTLDEIERIGRESGIDPAHLRAAAAEIDEAGRTLARQSGQSQTQVYVERWIDAPFTAAGWEDAVSELRTRFGATIGSAFGSTTGETVQQVGQSFEWSHTSPLGVRTRVTASPRGDQTRLRVTQLVGMASSTVEGVAYGGIIAAVLAVAAVVTTGALSGSAGLAAVVGALSFLLSWVAAAPLVAAADRRWRARKLRELGDLADDLVPVLRVPADQDAESEPERLPEDADGVPEADGAALGRLDLDALPDAPEADGRDASRGRVRG